MQACNLLTRVSKFNLVVNLRIQTHLFDSFALVEQIDGDYCSRQPDKERDVTSRSADSHIGVHHSTDQTADTGYTGCYYGTYDYTAYWDGGKQKQGNRAYFVFEYNGCYYLNQVKDPTEEAASYKSLGAEGYYKKLFGGERYSASDGSFDPAAKTATYMTKSVMNEDQYVSSTYTITFDGKGGMTVKWDSQNVYKGQGEPQEAGTFTGEKK